MVSDLHIVTLGFAVYGPVYLCGLQSTFPCSDLGLGECALAVEARSELLFFGKEHSPL